MIYNNIFLNFCLINLIFFLDIASELKFGGFELAMENGATGQTLVFNLDTFQWSMVLTSPGSTVPAGRYAHSAAVIDNSMYVFGGIQAPSTANTKDLFKFSFGE